MIATVVRGVIRLYQLTLSPIVGGGCRFEPSCSAYAMEAIDRHGAWHGVRLGVARLLRCHPFATAGYDPVPESDLGRTSQRVATARGHEKFGLGGHGRA